MTSSSSSISAVQPSAPIYVEPSSATPAAESMSLLLPPAYAPIEGVKVRPIRQRNNTVEKRLTEQASRLLPTRSLVEENSSQRLRKESREIERGTLYRSVTKLIESAEKTDTENERLLEEIQDLTSEIRALDSEVDTAYAELTATSTHNAHLKNELERAESAYAELEQASHEITEIQAQLREVTKKNAFNEKLVKKVTAENIEIQSQLEKAQKENIALKATMRKVRGCGLAVIFTGIAAGTRLLCTSFFPQFSPMQILDTIYDTIYS